MRSEPTLREVQNWTRTRIRGGAGPDAARLARHLRPQGRASGIARMEVYASGYAARIRESLVKSFEAVKRIVGEAAFTELAAAYAKRQPSREYDLSRAGKHFPKFLKGAAVTKKFRFLPDLAALEWQAAESFHAFDGKPLEPQALAAVF